mmetsp:Transcript_80220/g.259789  ORF Transcript_80220/g.259789 Transcript_80220/m.259789 type:complete len:198 (+) Transcript_80220:59-652(+)
MSMWLEAFLSREFWVSFGRSYVINIAFGITVNLLLNWGKDEIQFIHGLQGDMSAAFLFSALFCGLLTPALASRGVARKVQASVVRPPAPEAVAESQWRWLLRRGLLARCLLLSIGDLVLCSLTTVMLGNVVCAYEEGSGPCELPVWAFLTALVVWCIPLQILTSLMNFVAAAHGARDQSPLVAGACGAPGQLSLGQA